MLIRGLFGFKEPFTEFKTENKEELFQILKKTLKEEEKLDIILDTSQKEEIYKKLNKQVIMYKKNNSIENHKVQSEIMLENSKISLEVDIKEKTFELKEILKFSEGKIDLTVKDIQVLLEEYATIISQEKIEYRLAREKQEEEQRIAEEEKLKKKEDFNNFFEM